MDTFPNGIQPTPAGGYVQVGIDLAAPGQDKTIVMLGPLVCTGLEPKPRNPLAVIILTELRKMQLEGGAHEPR